MPKPHGEFIQPVALTGQKYPAGQMVACETLLLGQKYPAGHCASHRPLMTKISKATRQRWNGGERGGGGGSVILRGRGGGREGRARRWEPRCDGAPAFCVARPAPPQRSAAHAPRRAQSTLHRTEQPAAGAAGLQWGRGARQDRRRALRCRRSRVVVTKTGARRAATASPVRLLHAAPCGALPDTGLTAGVCASGDARDREEWHGAHATV